MSKDVRSVQGRYGTIFYWASDFVIGHTVETYHEYFESEVDVFRLYVKPGDTAFDLGANIGTHTQALASIVGPTGRVVAMEPQKPMSMLACANAIVNGYINVDVYRMAAGAGHEVIECMFPDYHTTQSFGAFEAKPLPKDSQYVRMMVQVAPVDDLVGDTERVTLIKIDIEGNELAAIKGAEKTIKRCHPVLYLENNQVEKSKELIEHIWSLGYTLYWHMPPDFNPNNLARCDVIIHPVYKHRTNGRIWVNGLGMNMLAVPDTSLPLPSDAIEVIDSEEHPCHDDPRLARPNPT